MKPFTTIDDQIKILKSRNLIINDVKRTKHLLLKENYYNIINGYKDSFLSIKKDKANGIEERYYNGVGFEEIYALYKMDRKIRNILSLYLLMFENKFKAVLAYEFSKEYEENIAYLDYTNYNHKGAKNLNNVMQNIYNLTKVIKRYSEKESYNSIKHYLREYDGVPLWVLINYLTFGNTAYLHKSLKSDVKVKILKSFSDQYRKDYNVNIIYPFSEFEDIVFNLSLYRNLCAHNERLYCFENDKDLKLEKLALSFNKNNSTRIQRKLGRNNFTMLFTLKYVIPKNDYSTLIQEIIKIISFYEKQINSVSLNKIYKKMGYNVDDLNLLINGKQLTYRNKVIRYTTRKHKILHTHQIN